METVTVIVVKGSVDDVAKHHGGDWTVGVRPERRVDRRVDGGS